MMSRFAFLFVFMVPALLASHAHATRGSAEIALADADSGTIQRLALPNGWSFQSLAGHEAQELIPSLIGVIESENIPHMVAKLHRGGDESAEAFLERLVSLRIFQGHKSIQSQSHSLTDGILYVERQRSHGDVGIRTGLYQLVMSGKPFYLEIESSDRLFQRYHSQFDELAEALND